MAVFRVTHRFHGIFRSSSSANPHSLSLFRESIRRFSTEQGAVYGRLLGISENTLKTDIINLFEGCGLNLDDIKVEYDRMFNPLAMLLQFPSFSAFGVAIKENTRKGRLLKLDKVDRQHWDVITSNNGHYVLLQGLPRNAQLDDVERFLSGCNYLSSSFEIFTRPVYPDFIRMAKVGFPSQIEAMNAIIQKNRSFCLNNRIFTRLIQ